MKSYHTIQKYTEDHYGKFVWAFDKVDGSNFRVEWDRKLSKKSQFTFGFKKFGTRTEMIMNNRNPFIEAVTLFEMEYAQVFDRIFKDAKEFRGAPIITLYGEFYGPGSFAGMHDWSAIHSLVFYDAFIYKKRYLPPADFQNLFEELPIQKLIWKGIFNGDFVKRVETNEFGLAEGVVYKGVEEGEVFMGKIKTLQWLESIRSKYGEKKMLEY
jgi:hypothetical protein